MQSDLLLENNRGNNGKKLSDIVKARVYYIYIHIDRKICKCMCVFVCVCVCVCMIKRKQMSPGER